MPHLSSIREDVTLTTANIICFTESHLKKNKALAGKATQFQNYVAFHSDRDTGMEKGGILVLGNERNNPAELEHIQVQGLEVYAITVFPVPNHPIIIITL